MGMLRQEERRSAAGFKPQYHKSPKEGGVLYDSIYVKCSEQAALFRTGEEDECGELQGGQNDLGEGNGNVG